MTSAELLRLSPPALPFGTLMSTRRRRACPSPESRERANVFPLPVPALRTGIATSPEQVRSALRLVDERYSWRGYQACLRDLQERAERRREITMIAEQLKEIVGTLTMGFDGPQELSAEANALVGTVGLRFDFEHGLAADELYGKEVDLLRQSGARLCEFTRLAVDKSAASKPVLAGLFHSAYLYAAKIRGCTHAVIEVTPRHSGFYHRALRFDRIGTERLNPRVNTQGVLMCVALDAIAEGLAKYAGKPDVPGAMGSLFVYGFPPDEEAGVLNRLYETGANVLKSASGRAGGSHSGRAFSASAHQ